MAKTMIIVAKDGLRIPRPEGTRRYLEGGPHEVDVSTFERLAYWQRRVDHGEANELTGADADKARADIKARQEKQEADDKAAAARQSAPSPAPQTKEGA